MLTLYLQFENGIRFFEDLWDIDIINNKFDKENVN
jgi:hypothetical protein